MSLEVKIMDHMKTAMKAKDAVALEALRAIKAAILIAKTAEGSGGDIKLGIQLLSLVLMYVHFTSLLLIF